MGLFNLKQTYLGESIKELDEALAEFFVTEDTVSHEEINLQVGRIDYLFKHVEEILGILSRRVHRHHADLLVHSAVKSTQQAPQEQKVMLFSHA